MDEPSMSCTSRSTRALRRSAKHSCSGPGCASQGQKSSLVNFLDGKFELCGACKASLVNQSVCTRFRCPSPSLCNDAHPMMVCSNPDCLRVTHVACEKPEIASKAINNPNYLYFCFDCRSSRVRYKAAKEQAQPELSREDLFKIWPMPKKRPNENFRYAYAESYKDINELLTDAKIEPLIYAKELAMSFLKVNRRAMASSANDKLFCEDETELEKNSEEGESKLLRRGKRVKKA